MKKRLINLDVIRLFACWCVATIHFNASVSGYDISGMFLYPNHIVPNHWFGDIYLGDIGVGLFFLVSGASLECTNPDGCRPLGKFYYKRFRSIYPGYWIAFLIATMVSLLVNKGIAGGPISDIWTSILGLDGYFLVTGWGPYRFYQVGEWFLGCILILYLIYPLVSELLHRIPILFGIGFIIFYLLNVRTMSGIHFLMCLPSLLVGMIFVRYIKTVRSWKVLLPTAILLVIKLMCPEWFANTTATLIVNWTIFVAITLMTDLLPPAFEKVAHLLKEGGALTYYIFLVHHKLIFMLVIICSFNLEYFPKRDRAVLYMTFWVISIWLARKLQRLTDSFVDAAGNAVALIKSKS